MILWVKPISLTPPVVHAKTEYASGIQMRLDQALAQFTEHYENCSGDTDLQ